jgi:threonine synthase
MGEGFTPLVPLDVSRPRLLAKADYIMPALSFKDRGAVTLIAHALIGGAARVVADSSGNAGASLAAYAARAGLPAQVFVAASTPAAKVNRIRAYGAMVRTVPGTRADTAAAAWEEVDATGAFYASHVYNPFFLEGTQTFAFEVWEQLGGQVPDTVILPAGNGTLVLGAALGFQRLNAAGLAPRVPRIVAVQAAACAPLAAAWERGEPAPATITPAATEAEGIAIAVPARGEEIIAAVAASGGRFATVTEDQLASAGAYLASRGFAVEPTGAVAYAGVGELEDERGTVVVALTGAGR